MEDDDAQDDEKQPAQLFGWSMRDLHALPEMAIRLDGMMKVVLQYIGKYCQLSDAHAESLFRLLLRIFDQLILKSFQSKYTQFLVFYVCTLRPVFPQQFTGYLMNKILDPKTPPLAQQACFGYVPSFLARFRAISTQVLRDTLSLLVHWVHQYLDTKGRDAEPDVELHHSFYCACQAIYYIFCFKHAQLLDCPDGAAFFRRLGFGRINASPLNPLKVCTIEVVREFAKVSAYFSSDASIRAILERNRKIFLPTNSALLNSRNRLDSFFPFDPYNLPASASFISDAYVEWIDRAQAPAELRQHAPHVPRIKDDDNNDDEDDDDEDDDDNDIDDYSSDDASDILSTSLKTCSLDDDEDAQKILSSTPDVFSDLNFC